MISKKGVSVNFFARMDVPFGKGVYLIGNIPELGEWKLENGIRLKHAGGNNWNISVQMERHPNIQYKFFFSNFDFLQMNDIQWQQLDGNRKLTINESQEFIFPNMSLCSFNVRLHTQKDEGPNHWDARKDKIFQFFDKNQYDFIGIQQATFQQRTYLQLLMNRYEYHGKQREHEDQQECGIFVKKDKFQILEQNYQWNSQIKQQTLIEMKEHQDNYFSSLIIAPRVSALHSQKIQCLLLINLHLSKLSTIKRKADVEKILSTCLEVKQRFSKNNCFDLIACVIMGDFNQSQYSSCIGILRDNKKMPFKSMRKIEGADQNLTYHGFQNKYLLRLQAFIANSFLAIDHMFYWVKQNIDIAPAAFKVGKQKSGEYMSHHYPIIGQFKAQERGHQELQEQTTKFQTRKQKIEVKTKTETQQPLRVRNK